MNKGTYPLIPFFQSQQPTGSRNILDYFCNSQDPSLGSSAALCFLT